MITETGANYEIKVGADGKITCAGTSNIKPNTIMKQQIE